MIDFTIPDYSIFMYKDDTDNYPRHSLPEGFYFKFYEDGDDIEWAKIEHSLGQFDTVEEGVKCFRSEFIDGQALNAKERVLFVMSPDGDYAATASLWDGNFFGEHIDRLHWLAVYDKYAGRGIAKALFTRLMDLYNELGLSGRLYLWTGARYFVAISMYRKFGFIEYMGNVEPCSNQKNADFARNTAMGVKIVNDKLGITQSSGKARREIKIGIFGLGRGSAFYQSILLNDGDIVAVCDRDTEKLQRAKREIGKDTALYTDFDEFLNHPDMEAVFLCNCFDQHAPFAIKALEKGVHVLSECTSNATMAEGVALMRAAEKSDAYYMIAENYPFMKSNLEMKRVVEGGTLGKILYAEGEYNHPVPEEWRNWIRELRPYEKHWRNYIPRTYYITHSLGPLMHVTGAFPKKVTALPIFEPKSQDMLFGSAVGDAAAIITCLNDDNSVFRVTGCSAFGWEENSYRFCGIKGQIESVRDRTENILLSYNHWQVPEGRTQCQLYQPSWHNANEKLIDLAGHGGSDFVVIREFFDCIIEGRKPFFDAYCATTMASVAIMAHRSILDGGKPYDIPDLRLESERIKYENDTATPFWVGDTAPTIPCCSRPDFKPDEEDVLKYQKLLRGE